MPRMRPLTLFAFLLPVLLLPAIGGCAVVAVGSAAVSTASLGVKAVTTAGGLAVDGASAAARAVSSEPKKDEAGKRE